MPGSINQPRSPGWVSASAECQSYGTAWRVPRRARHGAILLEVVLALGLLIFGMAVIGAQVRSALAAARECDMGMRAAMLTDTVLAELDANVIRPDLNDDEITGDFGVRAPGFTWRIEIEPCDTPNLFMATIDIGFSADQVADQIASPTYEIDFDDPDVKIVRTAYRLYPTPPDVNMERDYGLTPEDLDLLAGNFGGAVGGGEGGEGGDGDDGGGGGMGDLAALAEQFGIDMTAFDFLFDPAGFDPRNLAMLPEEDFLALATLLEKVFQQGGGALSELTDAIGTGGMNNVVDEGRRRRGSDDDADAESDDRRRR